MSSRTAAEWTERTWNGRDLTLVTTTWRPSISCTSPMGPNSADLNGSRDSDLDPRSGERHMRDATRRGNGLDRIVLLKPL